jgi:hypothetical protein
MLSLAVMLILQFTLISGSDGAEKGMVGYWRFNEGSGKITKDSSKFENNGELFGNAKWVKGIEGTAIDLNGDGDCVAVPQTPGVRDITDGITIEAWVYPHAFGEDKDYGEKSVLIRVPYYLALTGEAGKFGTYLYDVTVDGWVNSKSILKKEEWAYIAVTYDRNTKEINLYLNGELDLKKEMNGAPIQFRADEIITIGGERKNIRFFDGIIDEVQLWANYAKTPKEIKATYLGIAPVESSGKLSTTWGELKQLR